MAVSEDLGALPAYPVDEELVRSLLGRAAYRDDRREITAGEVVAVLRAGGVGAYPGCGTPRDWLCGEEPRDFDLFVDCELETAHALLRRAFPEVDPARRPRPDGFVLVWGNVPDGEVEITLLRSWRDIQNQDSFTTRFPVRDSLVDNALLMDFSVNTLVYDFGRRRVLDPLSVGTGDVLERRLRLTRHPLSLASNYTTSLRIVDYLGRGYSPAEGTLDYLAARADRDVLGMGGRLRPWFGKHVTGRGVDPGDFARHLATWLRSAEARRLLDELLAGLAAPERVAP
jgi:poly(A) polymerase